MVGVYLLSSDAPCPRYGALPYARSLNNMAEKQFSLELGGRTLSLTFSNWAEQANSSIIARYGDTVVLTTAVMGRGENDPGYFPLTVEYRENYYAAGKIGGGRFHKREGKPSDESVLKARLVDRALRPLFPHAMRREIQIVNSVLSYDSTCDPDILALVASSAAVFASNIPWNGPLGALRVAKKDGSFIVNPSEKDQEEASFVVTMAGTAEAINMLEIGANEASEQEIVEALTFGKEFIAKLVKLQQDIRNEIGAEKEQVELKEASEEVKQFVRDLVREPLRQAIFAPDKIGHESQIADVTKQAQERLTETYGESQPEAISLGVAYVDEVVNELVHEAALKENRRVDGRGFDEIRPLSGTASVLPRVHGSGMFMRGLTHVLSVATLAIPGNEELHDDMEGESQKRFMHHYNFPPYSVGETGFFRGPGRREIGHGALAEKALRPLIPNEDKFPYVVRLVSEVLSSNGSSSMGSVCGSSLALFDAGVPLESHVAGIAMGLMSGEGESKILTDIQGPEDHHGDMDLKVAGTSAGVTAVQMDVKIEGVSIDLLAKALEQAKKARLQIIDVLSEAIPAPRQTLSPYAPAVQTLQINPAFIGQVIGSGGSTIKEIQATTETEIDIEDDGRIFVGGTDAAQVERAVTWIKQLTHEVKVGEKFLAKVVKIADFGAFVELTPGQEALVHVSELKDDFVKNVGEVVEMGQRIPVVVTKIDEMGRVNASAKQLNAEADDLLNLLEGDGAKSRKKR